MKKELKKIAVLVPDIYISNINKLVDISNKFQNLKGINISRKTGNPKKRKSDISDDEFRMQNIGPSPNKKRKH